MTGLLGTASLEMTGKDVAALREAAPGIPAGTPINVTYLEHEDVGLRVEAARVVAELGFVPVPHISARRLRSESQLREFLDGLSAVGATEQVFVVGGDPSSPHGPYADALAVVRSGLLAEYGVREVGIAGYPEGHPHITEGHLWAALEEKAAELERLGLRGSITTQFGFDVEPVVGWISGVRARGIALPIRVGIPGPVGVRRLISYASRFGVGTSASIARKYGFSITHLAGTAGPDKFVLELAGRLDPEAHGDVRLHLYTFGGMTATSTWLADVKHREIA